jgi:catechol 2,3-dioxygenase-like lactoylglutathione lyase family enzyme
MDDGVASNTPEDSSNDPRTVDQQITFFYTRDLATTVDFYERIVGFPLVVNQGDCRIYRVTSGAYLGFCQRAEAPPEPRGVLFTLVTEDVDGWYAHLRGQGVPFDKAPALNERYGIYHCFARDPNGYLIEIQRFLDPDWHHPPGTDEGGA